LELWQEALVVELRQMNDEANANCDGLRVSEVFQRQYATVVLQLKEANKQVLPFLFLGMDLSNFQGFLLDSATPVSTGQSEPKCLNQTMQLGDPKDSSVRQDFAFVRFPVEVFYWLYTCNGCWFFLSFSS
jgi:hypothetical protein